MSTRSSPTSTPGVRSTLQAMALMAETRDKGALIHSNLDDGYGDMAPDMGLLLGLRQA